MTHRCFQCCWQSSQKKEKKPLVVDVLEVIRDEVWADFRSGFGSLRRKFLKRSDYEIDVPESYFVFNPIGDPDLENISDYQSTNVGSKPLTSSNNIAVSQQQEKNDTAASLGNDAEDAAEDVAAGNIRKVVALDTTFSNATDEKQTYQFKFSKTRSTRVEVTYQKGFSFGDKTNITIGLPKKLANCSLGLFTERRLEIKKSRRESFGESVTMEATSDITVLPNSKYVAEVQMEERIINTKFTVRIRMSMPQGHAPIYIRRKSDNVIVFVDSVDDLPYLFFGDEEDKTSRFPCVKEVIHENHVVPDKVDFLVEGFIKGNIACDHTINLTSEKMDSKQMKQGEKTE